MDPNIQPAFQAPQQQPFGPPPPKRSHVSAKVYIALGLLGVGLLATLVLLIMSVSKNAQLEASIDEEIESQRQELLSAQETELKEAFEKEKLATTASYKAPAVFGGISVNYPKDWSLYLQENERNSTQVDAIFHPGGVRAGSDSETTYALRLQLIDNSYRNELNKYQSKVDKGALSASPITVGSTKGVLLSGEIDSSTNGRLALVPFLDKTVILITETNNYASVFDQALKSISFSQ